MKCRLAPLIALLVLTPLAGQETHRLLVWYAGPEREKYVSALVASLANETRGLRVVLSALEEASPEEVAKEARQLACDMVLMVRITDAQGRDQVSWGLSSPQEPQPRATGTVTKNRPDWPAAADLYWLFLGADLDRETGPSARPWPQPVVSERATFTVAALPGTVVVGFPEGPLTIDETGQAQVELDLPVSIPLEGHLVGVRTTPQRVFVDQSGQTAILAQQTEPAWAVTVGLTNFAFPFVSGEWNLPRSRLVVRASLDQYLGGLSLQNAQAGSGGWPLASLPLMALSAGAAWVWSWPEDEVRFYTSADLGVRLTFPQFKTLALDPVIPVTLLTAVGWEYRWGSRHAAYFELGPTFSLVADSVAYWASLPEDSESLHILLPGIPVTVDLPFQAKLGYRWAF